MAKAIATVSGVALAPGVSRNGRRYTREAIAKAVTRAQGRIAGDGPPMTMLTHHAAEDDSTKIVGRLTSMTLGEHGEALFSADIAGTEDGEKIAQLLDTSDGKPAFLKNVSIRGAWLGKVRRESSPDGPVETGDDLELDGLDYTRKPGVTSAEVTAFAWAKDGATETDQRVRITESVEEARVTITEDTVPGVPGEVREALRVMLGTPVAEAGTPSLSKRDSGLKDDSGRNYADPGYQADKKQRYDLSTAAHAKAAWSFINKPANQKFYSAQQLKRIKGRIKAALQKFGITPASEGWCIDAPVLITEAIAEYAGMAPECAGSYSLSATNGPTTVTVCSYGLDPADLHVILAQACSAASAALCSIDPDMDGDIDVPGADAEDTDGDMGGQDPADFADQLAARIAAAIKGESAEDPAAIVAEMTASRRAVTEAAPDSPAPDHPAAANQGTEAPMQETTTTEAAATAPAATFSQADLDAAIARGVAQAEEARRARKAAKRVGAPAESAPAATVTETDEQRIARIVDERVAAAVAAQAPAAVTETDEQRIDRLVNERMTAVKQDLTASGAGPGRKGLVTEHSAAAASGEVPADLPLKNGAALPMEEWTDGQRRAVGRELERYVLGSRASQ